MNKNALNVGDVVELKVGGPKMVISSIETRPATEECNCRFWNKNDSYCSTDSFPAEALVKAS